MEAKAEQVYQFIWDYLKAHDVLPSQVTVAAGLHVRKTVVSRCVNHLRAAGRLHPTTLLPTAYAQWWRENVRAEKSGQWPQVPRWRKDMAQAR